MNRISLSACSFILLTFVLMSTPASKARPDSEDGVSGTMGYITACREPGTVGNLDCIADFVDPTDPDWLKKQDCGFFEARGNGYIRQVKLIDRNNRLCCCRQQVNNAFPDPNPPPEPEGGITEAAPEAPQFIPVPPLQNPIQDPPAIPE